MDNVSPYRKMIRDLVQRYAQYRLPHPPPPVQRAPPRRASRGRRRARGGRWLRRGEKVALCFLSSHCRGYIMCVQSQPKEGTDENTRHD
jgi:hypothetical protein